MKRQFITLAALLITASTALAQTQKVFAKIYPERLDDLTWENEYCGFRAYGPALEDSGQRAYGYDIWVKNTHDTIVDLRYRLHFPPKGVERKSFHQDWGNGMDCYAVGPTLGCCTAALLGSDGKIVYPWCWKTCTFEANTPTFFQAHLVNRPVVNEGDTIVEHRRITAMAGQRLCRCEVWYEGLSRPRQVAVGIVVHAENTDSMTLDLKHHYIAYPDLQDPTMEVGKDKGIIYVGALVPTATEMLYEQDHLLAIQTLVPGQHLVYYFGATWSKFDIHTFEEWNQFMRSAEEY